MNDVFPNFNTCCCFEPRVSMMLIAVTYIMGGASLVLLMEIGYKADMDTFKNLVLDATSFKFGRFFQYNTIMPVVLIMVGVSYAVVGTFTLVGDFFDQEVLVQLSVWITFITLLVALALLVILGYACARGNLPCIFAGYDFLTISGIVFALIVLLGIAFYFLFFINTQVEQN